jgi:hypothetical protein
MRIQNLIDEYRAGAMSPTDRISAREHVFFLLNGIPQLDERDVELRLINSQLDDLTEDPKTVIKKIRDREDAIKSSKGISSEVALYTNAGGLTSGKSKKKTDRKDKRPDAVTCYFCKQSEHIKRHCPERKDNKAASDMDASDTDVSDKGEASDVDAETANYVALVWTMPEIGPVKLTGAGGAIPSKNVATAGHVKSGHAQPVVGGGY